jgi:predicted dehydrogenase
MTQSVAQEAHEEILIAPVRVGAIGLGNWGPNIVRNLDALPEAEVVALCDLKPEALAAVARRYPRASMTDRYEEILADPSIEAVAIATPVGTHASIVGEALTAGKHVFIEKPLAASSSDALALIEMADECGLVLMPGHTFLYSPAVNAIRDLIQSGEIGDIFFVSMSRVNLGLHQSDVSVAWDLGPHDFSILRYWLGEMPTHVTALARGCVLPDIPDVAFIHLEFASGAIAHVEISWLAPSKLRRTTLVGSRKMLVYDDTSTEPVRVFNSGAELPNPTDFGQFQLTYRTGDILSPRIDIAEPLLVELEDFCRAIRTGSEPRSHARLGLEVVKVIEAVDSSLDSRGERVALDLTAPSGGRSAV